MRLIRLIACFFAVASLALMKPAVACGPRELGIVDDWLEAVDDASRAGDFEAALSYANSAVAVAKTGVVFPACTVPLTQARLQQVERRRDYFVSHGRTVAALDAALRIDVVYPKGPPPCP